MNNVVVASAAMTPFTDHYDRDIRDLASEVIRDIFRKTDIERSSIDGLVVGSMASMSFTNQGNLGALIAGENNLNAASFTVEAGEASGQAALRAAYSLVKSGMHEAVLVLGLEKVTDIVKLPELLSVVNHVNMDSRWEADIGLTLASSWAMIAKSHMSKFGTTREQIASVAVKNHYNATFNPYAQFKSKLRIETILRAPALASPLTLFDTCAAADGAAAVLLTTEERAKSFTDQYIHVKGTGLAHGKLRIAERENLYSIPAIRQAAKQAYDMAGISPADIDVAEVHDSYTIAELIALEEMGIFKPGESGPATEDGRTKKDGDQPINTSGGMKARGYPFGAAGIAQVVEIYEQLLGLAGERQISDAKIGVTQALAGTGGTSLVHVFGTA